MPFPREPSRPKDQTWVSCISCTGRWILYHSLPFLYWATWEVTDSHCSTIYNSQDIEATKVSINRWINKKIWCTYIHTVGFPSGSLVKNPRANAGDVGLILGSKDPLKEEMATQFSILAWEIPQTEEPGGLVYGMAKESDMT